MMREIVGYLPKMEDEKIEYKKWRVGAANELELLIPHLTETQLEKIAVKVKQASMDVLKTYSIYEIINIIDRVIEQLLDRTNPYRKKAEALLPILTGYDREMVRLGLTSYLKSFRKQELQRFLVEDFTNPLILDDFQPRAKRGFSKAVGPNLIAHVWSGNVPGIPLWSFISGLLVKSGNIGKVSSGEPLFAGLFAQLLSETAPALADCFAVVWWKGGDVEREQAFLQQSDLVLGYGKNESLKSLREQIPITTRFIPYGHKFSFGIIAKTSLDAQKVWKTAHDAAYDVIRYDQQGCYSPHVFYVQRGGKIAPEQFAAYVAHALSNFEIKYPRKKLNIEEAAAVSKWRQQEEISSFSRDKKEILGDISANWTVVYEDQIGQLAPSILNRTIRIVAIDRLEDIIPYVKQHRKLLQTVGIACSPKELFYLANMLSGLGVIRITGLGNMTSPESGWHHDGRFSLLDLVDMVDIEHAAESYAEQFAPYAD